MREKEVTKDYPTGHQSTHVTINVEQKKPTKYSQYEMSLV